MGTKKIIVLATLLTFSICGYAQMGTFGNTANRLQGENVFLDGTEYSDGYNTNVGKGIAFPTTDLTQWEFVTTTMGDLTLSTYYDGLIVYNTATGQTKSGQGVQVNVRPGFYYFSNPTGSNTDKISKGQWIAFDDIIEGANAPTGTGNAGEVYVDTATGDLYTSDGSGWTKVGDASLSLWDADGDTGIQMEESTDEDKIRFDTDGNERMIIDNTGNVGIGTTAPTAKFHVDAAEASVPSKGLVRLGDKDYSSQTNNVLLSVAPGVVEVDAPGTAGGRFKIDDTGNVGIGAASPDKKLDVNGEVKIRTLNAGTTTDAVVVAGTDGVLKKVASSSVGSDDQKLTVAAGAANTSVINLEDGNNVTLAAASNIDISESSSTITLEVDEADLSGIPTTSLTPGTNGQVLTTTGGSVSWEAAATDGDAWGVSGEDITSSVQRSGNVGIGISGTGTFDARLQVQSPTAQNETTSDTERAFRIQRGGTLGKKYNSTADFHIGTYATGLASKSQLDIRLGDGNINAGNVDVMSLRGDGNVGIGTTAPTAKFHVDAALASVPTKGLVRLGDLDYSAQTNNVLLSVAPGVVEVDAPGIKGGRFKIDDTGNVGIGVNDPSEKLHINGGESTTVAISDNANTGNNLGLAMYHGGASGKGMGLTWNDVINSNVGGLIVQTINNTGGFVSNHTTFTRDGNLGIGVTAPTKKLDVNGEARIRTLTTGAATDQVVVAGTDGVLKKVASSSVGSDDQKVNTFAVSGDNLELELESDSGGKKTVPLADIVKEPWRTDNDQPATNSSTDIYYDDGGVTVGTDTNRQPFTTTGAVIGRLRIHSAATNIAWEDDDYIIIITNHGINHALTLPDPGTNNANNIPTGRIVCLRNHTGGYVAFAPGNDENNTGGDGMNGNGGGRVPNDYSGIHPQNGVMFAFDGLTWHPIASSR